MKASKLNFIDVKLNKCLYLSKEQALKYKDKENLKCIPEKINNFKSNGYIFTRDKENLNKFKKTKIKEPPVKVTNSTTSPSISKKICKQKNKLFEPVLKKCIEDTPYNRILIKKKEQEIRRNSPEKKIREKTPVLSKRRALLKDYEEDVKQESCISKSKIVLKEHQLKCVLRLLKQSTRGIITSFGVGTGKTLTAVACAECLLENDIVKKVIVATPKSLLNNFKKEIVKYHYGNDYTEKIDENIFRRYEIITHDGIKKKFLELKKTEEDIDDFFFIVDEAHDLRSSLDYDKIEEKKSSYFLELGLLATKVLLLTATPYVNNEGDLINLINVVKGGIPKMITRYPENDIEKEIFLKDTFMFFELDNDKKFEAGMPTSETFIKRFVMSPRYYNEYMDIEKGFNINWENPTVFLNGLRQASNKLEGNPKIEWVIDHVISTDVRTIIFSSYKDSGINLIKKSFIERGIKFAEITGDTVDRAVEVEKYNSGEVKIFFITKAGGTGLDLKKTKEVILLESSWNNSNEEQVIGRAIRMGSHIDLPKEERHVNIYKLILAKPVFNEDFKENKKFYKASADELVEYLRDTKKEKENEILTELRKYAYE